MRKTLKKIVVAAIKFENSKSIFNLVKRIFYIVDAVNSQNWAMLLFELLMLALLIRRLTMKR